MLLSSVSLLNDIESVIASPILTVTNFKKKKLTIFLKKIIELAGEENVDLNYRYKLSKTENSEIDTGFCLSILFPNIIVVDDYKQEHPIKNIIVSINITQGLNIESTLHGSRLNFSNNELLNQYSHSHLDSGFASNVREMMANILYLYEVNRFHNLRDEDVTMNLEEDYSRFCLGNDTSIYNSFCSFNEYEEKEGESEEEIIETINNITEYIFDLLKLYLQTENTTGAHRRISSVIGLTLTSEVFKEIDITEINFGNSISTQSKMRIYYIDLLLKNLKSVRFNGTNYECVFDEETLKSDIISKNICNPFYVKDDKYYKKKNNNSELSRIIERNEKIEKYVKYTNNILCYEFKGKKIPIEIELKIKMEDNGQSNMLYKKTISPGDFNTIIDDLNDLVNNLAYLTS